MGTQRGRRENAVVDGGVCTETSRSPWRHHCVSTASPRRVHGVCIAPQWQIVYSMALSQRPHRADTAITAFSRRSYGVLRRLQGADTALPVRCEQKLEKSYK